MVLEILASAITGEKEGEYVRMVNGDIKLFLLTDAMIVCVENP